MRILRKLERTMLQKNKVKAKKVGKCGQKRKSAAPEADMPESKIKVVRISEGLEPTRNFNRLDEQSAGCGR